MLTSIIFALGVWVFVYLSHDLFNRTNPSIVQTSLLGVTLEEELLIDPNTFNYVFGVMSTSNRVFFVNESIYTISASIIDNEFKSTPIKFTKCSPKDVNDSIKYNGELICLQGEQNNLFLKGENSVLSFVLSKCVNSTQNSNSCASPAEIDAKLANTQFYVYFAVYSVVTGDYLDPIKKNWNYQNYWIDLTATKLISPILKKVELTTDDGWLLGNLSSVNTTVHQQFIFDFVPGP